MNTKQQQHLKYILNESQDLIAKKYRRGSREHQSVLNEDYTAAELLDMALEEAIDQVTYLLTLKEKIDN